MGLILPRTLSVRTSCFPVVVGPTGNLAHPVSVDSMARQMISNVVRVLLMSFHTHYRVLRRFRHVILSVASRIILALALPKPGLWVFAWVGLVPLFVALRDARPLRAALCGLLTGIVYYGIILWWVSLFGILPWLLLVVYQALYIAVFAALFVRLM